MDANELGRWTRFAAKGGIGKCVAVQDCVAEEDEDLMFLKDDEIVVLMQLPTVDEVYLGYCEGVVGRFRGTDVRFLGRLKKPVMTKRSSRSLSRSSSRPSSSQSPAPVLGRESLSALAHRDSPSLPQAPSRLSHSYSAASTLVPDASGSNSHARSSPSPLGLPSQLVSTSPQISTPSLIQDDESHLRSVSHSSTSTAVDSTPRTPADFFQQEEPRSLVRIVSLSRQVASPSELDEDDVPEPSKAPSVVEEEEDADEGTFLYGGSAGDEQLELDGPSTSYIDSEPSTRISAAISEGDTGIGISLLQSFMNGNMDDNDARSVHSDHFDDSMATVIGHVDVPLEQNSANVQFPDISPPSARSSVYSHASQNDDGPASAVQSVRDVTSRTSTHPSGTDSDYGGEDWEGYSDIYDNYRYSRASMASKMSRFSKGSMHTVASGLGLEAPPPVPVDSQRPSMDSVRHGVGSLRDRLGSAATASSSVEDVRRTARMTDTGPASPGAEGSDGNDGPTTSRRVPPPLELASSNYNRLAPPGTPPKPGFSPLLHTAFHSPLPSPPGLHSPTYLSPMSSPGTTPLFSNTPGGAASALRQRLEMGRASPLAQSSSGHLAVSNASDEGARGKARLSAQPIDVDDDDGSVSASNLANGTPPTSPPFSARSFDSAAEKRRLKETTFIVANPGPPPPPYTPMSPTPGPSVPDELQRQQQAPQQPSTERAVSQGALLSSSPEHLQQSSAFARRSIFMPHPHAPKPADSPSGPMYGRAPPTPSSTASPATGPPPGSVMHACLAAIHASGDRIRPRLVTIYAHFQYDLFNSAKPVPVSFYLEPPPCVPPAWSRQPTAPTGFVGPARASSEAAPAQPQIASSSEVLRPDSQVRAARPRSRSVSEYNRSSQGETSVIDRQSSTSSLPVVAPLAVGRSKSAGAVAPSPVSSSSNSSSGLPDRALHKPSPLSMPSNSLSLGSSNARPPPSPLSRPPVMSPELPSPTSPVKSDHMSTADTSFSQVSSPVRSPVIRTSALPDSDSTQSPTSPTARSVSGSTVHSPPASPVKTRAGRLRHSKSSTFTRQSRDKSPQSRSSLQGRRSGETDASHQSDTRSFAVTSPTPTSHSLRSKLSLPSLRIKGIERFAPIEERSPTVSVTPSESQDQPTVQIKDVDFELVSPSQQLGIIDEDLSSSPLPSPARTDNFSALRAISPVFSMKSGSSARTGLTQSVVVEPPLPSSPPTKPVDTQEVEAHRQRELRWITMMASIPASQARKSKKIRKLVNEGVPASVRYLVWAHLTDSKARRMDGLYTKLIMRDRVPATASIERDVQRVFRDESQLLDGSLINVLQAYLTMVPDIQYSRGLTVVAGRLLLQAPEEDAFWTFVSMMDSHLRPYFSPSRVQLDIDAMLLGKAIEASEPVLAKKLFNDLDIPPISLCRPWFTAVFLEALPFEHSQRVWDVFLFEGVAFLFRVGLAIIQCCKHSITVTVDRDTILNTLLHPPAALLPVTADAFLEVASNLKFKDDDIRKQRAKLEAQSKRQTSGRNTPGSLATIKPLRPTPSAISLPRSN